MGIIKNVGKGRSLIECDECGFERVVTTSNYINGFGRKCSRATCGDSYIYNVVKGRNDDYSIVNISGNKVTMKCNICSTVKVTRVYEVVNEIGMNHTSKGCKGYFSSMVGSIYGDYVIVGIAKSTKNGAPKFVFKCSVCGREKTLSLCNIQHYSHSKCTPENKCEKLHAIWSNIKSRCKNNLYYANVSHSYDSYIDFYDDQYCAYLEALRKFSKPTLDRIDNFGGYNKENTRWTSCHTQQGNTRRSTVKIAYMPNGNTFKFSNMSVFGGFIKENPRCMSTAVRNNRSFKGITFVDTRKYNNTEEGVETNCIYKKCESTWVKVLGA